MTGGPDRDGGIAVAAEPFDAPDSQRLIAALEADLDERYAGDEADEPEPDWAMLLVHPASVAAPLGAFVVARLAGDAVGCGAIRPAPTGEPGTAEVKRMYVAPAARGRGVSRRLLQALEEHAAGLGYRRMVLETGVRQPEAMALYESAGYAPIASYGGFRASPLCRCYGKPLPPRR